MEPPANDLPLSTNNYSWLFGIDTPTMQSDLSSYTHSPQQIQQQNTPNNTPIQVHSQLPYPYVNLSTQQSHTLQNPKEFNHLNLNVQNLISSTQPNTNTPPLRQQPIPISPAPQTPSLSPQQIHSITNDENDSVDGPKQKRANQNLASKQYRQRKKEQVAILESQVRNLQLENQQLKIEKEKIQKDKDDLIKASQSSLGDMQFDPILAGMLAEIKQIVDNLKNTLKNSMDDSFLSYQIQIFQVSLERRFHLSSKIFDLIVNPKLQCNISYLGYISGGVDFPFVAAIHRNALWWNYFLESNHIPEDKINQVLSVFDEIQHTNSNLRKERLNIDRAIREFYFFKIKVFGNAYFQIRSTEQNTNSPVTPESGSESNFDFLSSSPTLCPETTTQKTYEEVSSLLKPSNPPTISMSTYNDFYSPNSSSEPTMSEILEFCHILMKLKSNFVRQAQLLLICHNSVSKILSPRDYANFVICWHGTIDTSIIEVIDKLKNVWLSLNSMDTPASLLKVMSIP